MMTHPQHHYSQRLRCSAVDISRPQAELRLEEPKMEAAGRYYGKDQADRERSDLSAYVLKSHEIS